MNLNLVYCNEKFLQCSVLFSGLVQPPVPKGGLGHLCCFAVGNVSPNPTGESKAFNFFFWVFYWSFALLRLEYCSPGSLARATVHGW